MKKILTFLMAAVLVFSLVACGTNNKETTVETKVETTAETTVETTVETEGETIAETTVETEAESTVKVFTALAVKDNVVVASYEGGEQAVYTLDAKDNPTLIQGHKYTFDLDPASIKDGVISVETSQMLGKSVGFALNPELVEALKSKVEGIKVVDTRKAEEFEASHAEGAVNVPAARYLEYVAAKDAESVGKFKTEFLSDFNDKDVVLVYGTQDEALEIATLIYKTSKTPVLLYAGEVK